MKVAFHTFGCKLNQYETESLAGAFEKQGFSIAVSDVNADIHVVNTCTVTSKSEQKARKLIRRLAGAKALVIATGCYAQVESKDLAGLGDNILVVPQSKKSRLRTLVAELDRQDADVSSSLVKFRKALVESEWMDEDPFGFPAERFHFHSRAFFKIQDGCDYRCAYCRIPLARGESRSLAVEKVVRGVAELELRGYREVVLTGVNITSFEPDLPTLLRELLGATHDVQFRLSSLEPEKIEEHWETILSHERICPHFHLPVQSGSDRILKAMHRRYRADNVVKVIRRLRSCKPASYIAGDFIAGFPGEQEDDFRKTVDLIHTAEFAKIHVFPFSSRPGTEAAAMSDKVDATRRSERVRSLVELSKEQEQRYLRSCTGKTVSVVLESSRSGKGRGLSDNGIKLSIEDLPGTGARPGIKVRCMILAAGDPCRAAFHSFC